MMINRLQIFYACLSFLAVIIFSNLKAQQIQPFKTTPKSVIGFIEYLPPDYSANNNKYPVVIFLHGLGQSGPSSNDPEVLKTGYNSLVFYGPPKFVSKGTNFPFILISPQLKNSYGNWPSWYVMEVIEYVKTYLRIDEKRIYITGTSLGGGGAWETAQDYPNYFAALAPVAGCCNSTSKACGIAASDLPVWAFHGDKDNVVSLSTSVNMVNAINACGTKSPAKLTIYQGLGHNAYSLAYDPTHNIHTPNLYDWMLAQVNDGGSLPLNKQPTANAGPDNIVILPKSIVLTGSGSDPDGTIIDYNWTKISGPGASLSKVNTTRMSAYNIFAGTYVFRLTVHDNLGAWHSDDVTVTVKSAGTNAIPVVNAGTDKTITLPVNAVTITGNASDPGGSIASYSWSKISGGNALLSGSNGAILSATNLVQGSYVFRLTVKDNQEAVNTDEVSITVVAAASLNIPPVVNAGLDKVLTLPTNTLTLVGNCSDSDGRITVYNWIKVSGSNAILNGVDTQTLSLSGLVEGAYVFRLSATDDRQATTSDDIQIIIQPAAGSIAKLRANGGGDKIVFLPVNSLTLNGSGTTPHGSIISYEWKQVGGQPVTMQNVNSANLVIVGVTTPGKRTFILTVRNSDNFTALNHVHIVFKEPTTARLSTDVEGPDMINEDLTMLESKALVSFNNLTAYKDCNVVVFNDMQTRIFDGVWQEDSYQNVFNESGLYFYRIVRKGKLVDSGKIFIR